MNDVIKTNKIVKSKNYSNGSIYLLDMTHGIWLVMEISPDNEVMQERLFCYTKSIKRSVWKNCLNYFKEIKKVLISKKKVVNG